jgi:hypothetical protein
MARGTLRMFYCKNGKAGQIWYLIFRVSKVKVMFFWNEKLRGAFLAWQLYRQPLNKTAYCYTLFGLNVYLISDTQPNCTESSHLWEVSIFSEIRLHSFSKHLLHYRVHKVKILVAVRSQMNPIRILTFILILYFHMCRPKYSKWLISFRFSYYNPTCFPCCSLRVKLVNQSYITLSFLSCLLGAQLISFSFFL